MKQKIEELEQFIIKHDELFFILIFFMVILGRILFVKTILEDEIWNFQNIYKMYNGYQIYIDANVITTPLFHYIGLIIFKIMGANFFVFKIYNVLIFLFLYLGIYKVFKSLNIRKLYSFFFTGIIVLLSNEIIYSAANYNTLVITFVIYAIMILIKREKYRYYILYESIFIFLIIITKQNIGIFYLIGYIIYTIIDHRQSKKMIKVLLQVLAFLLIGVFCLIKMNVFQEFINYCFLGIREFEQNNFTVNVKWVLILISVALINSLLIVFIIYNKTIKIADDKKNNIKIITCFAYPMTLISYPLLNGYHINVALIFQYILLIYIIYIIFKNLKVNSKSIEIILIIIIFGFSIKSVIYTYEYFYMILNGKYDYNEPYFGTLFDKEIENKIEKVTEYIEKSKKDVVILSPEAALYMIPLKQSNSEMDLILLGNLGKNGENNIIEKVSKLEDKIILINKEKISYQESDRLREYVIKNFAKIGEIEDLLIFKTK